MRDSCHPPAVVYETLSLDSYLAGRRAIPAWQRKGAASERIRRRPNFVELYLESGKEKRKEDW
jgi:hypothetical protein